MSKKKRSKKNYKKKWKLLIFAGVSEVEVEATEIENLKAELSEMEDKFLRARAEIANMSNRNKTNENY